MLAFALVAARLVPAVLIPPFFASRSAPLSMRLVLALGLAAALTPALGPAVSLSDSLSRVAFKAGTSSLAVSVEDAALFVRAVAGEAAIGAALGFVASLPFYAADSMGHLVDATRARASCAEADIGPAAAPSTPSTPLSSFTSLLAVVVFVGIDGHLLFLRGFGESYLALPVGGIAPPPDLAGFAELVIAGTARVITSALGMAAPVLAAAFLADLVVGLLQRAASGVPGYAEAAATRAVLVVLVLSLVCVSIGLLLAGESRHALLATLRVLELLAP